MRVCVARFERNSGARRSVECAFAGLRAARAARCDEKCEKLDMRQNMQIGTDASDAVAQAAEETRKLAQQVGNISAAVARLEARKRAALASKTPDKAKTCCRDEPWAAMHDDAPRGGCARAAMQQQQQQQQQRASLVETMRDVVDVGIATLRELADLEDRVSALERAAEQRGETQAIESDADAQPTRVGTNASLQ